MNSTNDNVGWTPEPQGRGTIGLLWGCFATLFLCTWSAVHPNLPALNDSQTTILWRKFRYVMCCLIAPEMIAWSALQQLLWARKVKGKTPGWSLKKCFFLAMGGFAVRPNNGQSRYLHLKQLVALFQNGDLVWPEISDEEIEDRSKANWLVKSFALMQIIWFITQLIGRWAQGLAATTLEIFTLGIVLCAVIIYGAYWEKPFEAQMPVVLPIEVVSLEDYDGVDRVHLISGFSGVEGEGSTTFDHGVIIFISLMFGAVHIVAWNFHFPSFTEQLLWRICSIGVIVTAILLLSLVLVYYDVMNKSRQGPMYQFCLFGILFLYTLFRLYMFVEMFISLRAAPASVYQTPEWSQYFPSFG